MASGFRRRSVLTGSPFSSALARWTQPGFIRQVQRGTVTILAGNTSATAAITSVLTANSRIKWLGSNDPAADTTASSTATVSLTNATTVTATSNTAPSSNMIVAFEVVEYFTGALKSVQRGTITITAGGTSNTATITTVNTARAELNYLGSLGPYSVVRDAPWLTLTNATTVTATNTATAADNVTVGFEVAEFY